MKHILIVIFIWAVMLALSLVLVSAKDTHWSLEIIPVPECSDGVDNDADGFIDFPLDEDCDSYNDTTEAHAIVTNTSVTTTSSITSPSHRRSWCAYCTRGGLTLEGIGAKNYAKIGVQIDGITKYIFNSSFGSDSFTISIDNLSVGTYIISMYGITPDNQYGEVISFTARIFREQESLIKNIVLPAYEVSGTDSICARKADLNFDCVVNLVDFSIGVYWYERVPSTAALSLERQALNGDGKIDMQDFSIMMYYWSSGYAP